MTFHFHERGCPLNDGSGRSHDDAAKRLRDAYNLHRVGDPYGSIGKWMAARFADGESDGVLYHSKRAAVLHQHNDEVYYTFIRIVPTSMTECNAAVMLKVARRCYDSGMRLTDPDHKHGGLDVIKRLSVEDQNAAARGIVQNVIWPRKG